MNRHASKWARLTAVLLILAMLPVFHISAEETDLARGRAVMASSVADESPPQNAVDGNPNTRWSSAYEDGQWIAVDLEGIYAVHRAVLHWETASASEYKLQFSLDGAEWEDAYFTDEGAGGVETIELNGWGRYIRMLGLYRATEWGFSLWSFEVYGTESAERPEGANTFTVSERVEVTPAETMPDFLAGISRKGFSYTYPTAYRDWSFGLLAGNGKQSVIVFGDPLSETVIFGDRGFNMPRVNDRDARHINTVSAENLQRIKDYLIAEQWKEANDLANAVHGWQDGGDGVRHPGYMMNISIPQDGPLTEYVRSTDYSTGEIMVNWTDARGDWSRKTFVSRADGVTVQFLAAPSGGKLDCSLSLGIHNGMQFPSNMTFTNVSAEDYLKMRVKYKPGTNDAGYEGVTRVIANGGTASLDGDVLTVAGADSVLLLTKTQKYRENAETEWNKELLRAALDALPADYDTLLQRNIETHGEIYGRVTLDLGGTAEDRAKSNEELIAQQNTTGEAGMALYERLFDAGRFHYLCSSYEYAPPDLLGLWTGDCSAGWGGYYHLNANLNLQVAAGNIGDMPEAMEGYFYLLEAWQEDFRANAQKLLGTRGMLTGGNSPGAVSGVISSLNYYYPYQYVTGGMGWLLYPFWEHYQITGDIDFLRDRYYPLIRDMGDFYEDFLTETDANGNFIFAGSVSSESQPPSIGLSLVLNSAFDIAGAKFALSNLIEVCNILGLEQDGGTARWQAILDKLPPYLVNDDGALSEWSWPGLRNENAYGHRHSSHLINVWPLREITPEASPGLFDAAVQALVRKDNAASPYEHPAGHGLLHGALIAANLNQPESVATKLMWLITGSPRDRIGFYYDNLATAHYPYLNHGSFGTFCADVAHAAPAILMEMLAISREGTLELLPAVIEDARTGSIKGMKGRSQFTLDELRWDLDQNLAQCLITSDIDQTLTIIMREGITAIRTVDNQQLTVNSEISYNIELKAGVTTPLTLSFSTDGETDAGNLPLLDIPPPPTPDPGEPAPPADPEEPGNPFPLGLVLGIGAGVLAAGGLVFIGLRRSRSA
jgi:hypothetical protein